VEINIMDRSSRAGGGALPLLELPSKCLGIKIDGMSPNTLERSLRQNKPPIIGRIENDVYVIDPRTLMDADLPVIVQAFEGILNKGR
jgi:L-seryl-tRNA(Ser) seleniumtransferase